MARRCGRPTRRPLGLGKQLRDSRIARRLLAGAREDVDRRVAVAFAEQGLPLEDLRGDRCVVELERDAHLGEHFVEPLEREQRLAEDDASLHGRRPPEQPQTTDLDGLLELPSSDERLAPGDEVALRHLRRDVTSDMACFPLPLAAPSGSRGPVV